MSSALAPDVRDALLAELHSRTTTPGFHFLSADHLARLNDATCDDAPVVSLYLDLSPEQRIGDTWARTLRDLRAQAEAEAPAEHRRAVAADLDRIDEALAAGLPRTGRGVAFFACGATGLFEQIGTAVALPASVHLDRGPHVRPLARVRDENDRFVIALVSAHKSRFFFSQIGLVEEVYTLDGEEMAVTDFVSKDQRQDIKDELRRAHAHRSAHATDLIVRELGARHVIHSVSPDMEAEFLDRLDQATRQRLAGSFACDIHASTPDVAAAAETVQRQTEAREESETLGRVEQLLHSRAVAGLDATVDMLNQQRVMTLVVDDEAAVEGGLDPETGLLSTQASGTDAGRELTRVPDLMEHMMERALAQGASLEIVRSEAALAALRAHGPVAALLRF